MTTYATVLLVENLIMIPLIILLLNRSKPAEVDLSKGQCTDEIIHQLVRNLILIAVMAGLIISLMSIDLPEFLSLPRSLLGTAAAPLALFTIGMALVGIPSIADMTDIAWTSVGKLILHPTLVAASCVLFVDNFHDPDVYAVILLASSPMASLYPVFGANYGSKSDRQLSDYHDTTFPNHHQRMDSNTWDLATIITRRKRQDTRPAQ